MSKDYRIVYSEKDHQEFEDYLNKFDYGAYDVEATGVNVRKDKIIGFSFSGEVGTGWYYPLAVWNKKEQVLERYSPNFLKMYHFLKIVKSKELLMWNGSYDIRITKNNLKVDLLDSLIAEVQLLKHTLHEDSDSFALKETALELADRIGLDDQDAANQEQLELKENVIANGGEWKKGQKDFYKADLEVLGKYACADADLTLRIGEYYNEKLAEEGLEEFFYEEEVMPLYKEVTIPMEDKGVALDLPLIEQSKVEIEADIEKLRDSVLNQLQENVHAQKWYNDRVFKHCEVSNKGNFVQGYIDYYELDFPKSEKSGKYSVTKKTKDLAPEEHQDFFTGEDLDLPKEVEYAIKEQLLLNSLKEDEEPLNISSKPQMGDIVFNYMKVKPLSKTDGGAPQFNEDMINWLAENEFGWAKELRDYNKLIKIRGTYIDRFLDNQENGRYYFSYKQFGTISGRYGSDAQQLPRPLEEGQESEVVTKYVNRIRRFFISGPGRKYIDSDYESLEPHVFAHVSGDEGLKDIFRKGHDFYSTIAIGAEQLYEYSPDKKADNYLGKMDKSKRQNSKEYSLGVPYGMGDYALGKTLGISTEEAADIIEGYLSGFPDLRGWMDRSKHKAHTEGFVRSEAGRVRHLPKVKKIYRVYKDSLMNFKVRMKLQRTMEKDEVKRLYLDYKNGVNNSRNFQIQSFAGSIVNRAAIAINRAFKQAGIDGWCCAQIHDQLIFEVEESRAEEARDIVQELMETTTTISLPLKAPAQIGLNWQEAH